MEITVVSVSNMGDESTVRATSQTEAVTLAKSMRVTSNHMVCIDVDGERLNRWDRDRIEGENRWTKTDPSEMETLGPIRMSVRGSGAVPGRKGKLWEFQYHQSLKKN